MRFITILVAALALIAAPSHAHQVWSDAHVEELADALAEAWTHGLDPDHYADPETLLSLAASEARDAAAREAFLNYAADLAFGRIDPRDLEPDWTAPVRDRDLEADLARALENADVFAVLEGLSPAHPDYLALRRELVRLNAVRREYTLVPTGPILEEGDEGERVDALRTRLAEEGLFTGATAPGAVFDTRLRTALVRYQARHNLAADGRAGPDTIRELNKNSQQRLDQVRANLERWRWVPRDLGERHIRVNLADYRLEAWEGGEIARVHRSMIGRGFNRTPVFSEVMTFIEINPVWYTPMSLGEPWLRRFRTNPAYALASGFRLVDMATGGVVNPSDADWANRRYRVIQLPGAGNSMGR